MRILLLSRNRVVQELVKLGIGDAEGAELEIAGGASELRGDRYDLLLLDDRLFRESGSEIREHLIAGYKVILGDPGDRSLSELFDGIVPKPFLPGDVRKVMEEAFTSERPERAEDEGLAAFVEEEAGVTEVLDEEEIRRIRRLLNDEPEATEEGREDSDGAALLSGESYRFEELMALLEESKVKKLKKLLRGARIHISIEFPEEG
jgi:hypothetical protein